MYHSKAPGPHQFHVLLAVPLEPQSSNQSAASEPKAEKADGDDVQEEIDQDLPQNPAGPARSPVFGDWYAAIVKDWRNRSNEIANQYGFTNEQKKSLDKVLENYDKQLVVVFTGNKEQSGYANDIQAYRHQLFRNRQMNRAPGASDIPNLVTRSAKRDANPTGEQATQIDSSPAEWLADVNALETAFEHDALTLRTDEQVGRGPLAETQTDLRKIDKIVTWTLIIGGACLVAGLFTRLSALVLAVFLGSIIVSQPPWVAGTVPTYFQIVEFLALLTLATSHVGRWGGLDFFVHHILLRPFRSA